MAVLETIIIHTNSYASACVIAPNLFDIAEKIDVPLLTVKWIVRNE